jgi:cardiolipin synthase (CMP-forming)
VTVPVPSPTLGQTSERGSPDRAALRWRDLFNVAGVLTGARLPLAVVFGWVLPDLRAALIVFVVAGVTDGLDGVVARRTKTCSHTGSMLDGFLDKVFLVNAGWGLVVHGIMPAWWLPLWFIREIAQIAMIPFVWMPFRQGRVYAHESTRAGKATTWVVGTALFAVLLGVPIVSEALTPIAAVLGTISGGQYLARQWADRGLQQAAAAAAADAHRTAPVVHSADIR